MVKLITLTVWLIEYNIIGFDYSFFGRGGLTDLPLEEKLSEMGSTESV